MFNSTIPNFAEKCDIVRMRPIYFLVNRIPAIQLLAAAVCFVVYVSPR
jgi:hypothetical protein